MPIYLSAINGFSACKLSPFPFLLCAWLQTTPQSLHRITHIVDRFFTKCGFCTLMFRLFFCALLHTDTLDCLLSSIPPPSIGLLYLLQFNLASTIPSYCLASCMISIWCCDMISPILMYNTHLRATDTTTSSIGGAQILIYLVNSTTDSLRWAQQYITCTSRLT